MTENEQTACALCFSTDGVESITDASGDVMLMCAKCRKMDLFETLAGLNPARHYPEITIHEGEELRVTLGKDGEIETVEAGSAQPAPFNFDAAAPEPATDERGTSDREAIDQIAALLRGYERDTLGLIRAVVLSTGRVAWPEVAGGEAV